MRAPTAIAPTLFAAALVIATLAPVVRAEAPSLNKGYRLLLERGIQLQGMVTQDDVFHLSTYRDLGYTSVNWLYSNNVPNSDVAKLGPPPGFPWSRWVSDKDKMPPQGSEAAYMSQCVGLALVDEQDVRVPATLDKVVALFNAVRDDRAYANVVLYTNNYGGQAPDGPLSELFRRAKPDMLFFDTYPFKSKWDAKAPEHAGSVQPADLMPWVSELRRYRAHSNADGIPFGVYTQTFHSVQDYDQTVYRDPSPSELRLNNNLAVAFNAKWLTGFTYNTGASSLFTRPGGDSHPTPLYAEQKLVNHRLKNWGNTLVRLKPIGDWVTNGTTTSMMVIRGQHADAAHAGKPAVNPLPIGFVPDRSAPDAFSEWEADKNDPYLRGWTVTNVGTKNPDTAGKPLPGDVYVSWFTPLDETFDGPNFKNEVYVMVVNSLTDPGGTAGDCAQEIRLNFLESLSSVQMLDPNTGRVVTQELPFAPETKTRRQLVLKLAGGDAALFKFNDGAPFVGVK